ncbi:MAG: omptin family outer membrane protease [Treponema sp.]|jgi:outer membrane protease|nr:omptin family outer membrane protease [Treponema sp.]
MKNITAFAVLVIILACTLPAGELETGDSPFGDYRRSNTYSPLNATTNPYALSAAPLFGVFYGQAEEIVYPADTMAKLLSQLLWDMKPLWYYGAALDLSQINPAERWGVFSTLSLRFGIPGMTGVMEDRDWMSIQDDALTHYSIHDNRTRSLFWMDFSAGFSIPLRSIFLLKAYAHVSYMSFAFSGQDGHGKRALEIGDHIYDMSNFEIYTFSGKVINYTQDWLIAAPGIAFACHYRKFFSADIFFTISPLILCGDMDEHLTTGAQFRDYMQGGLFLEPGAHVSFDINEWLGVSLKFAWRYIGGTQGDTYKKPYGTGYYQLIGRAGAGLSVMDAELLFKVRL